MQKTVATIKKNAMENIRVDLAEFNGHDLVGLRIYTKYDNGEWGPTKKGITVGVKFIPELRAALEAAEAEARAAGLLG